MDLLHDIDYRPGDMDQTQPSKYRPCVGTMIVDSDGRAFVGKRIDTREGDWWQMPQGGVDPGENPDEAVFREVFEETGIARPHLDLAYRLEEELFYDLPAELQGKLWGGKYVGQRQTWYLLRFTGGEKNIDLNAHKHPEFCEYKWVDPDLLPDLIIPFKREIYQAVVEGFRARI